MWALQRSKAKVDHVRSFEAMKSWLSTCCQIRTRLCLLPLHASSAYYRERIRRPHVTSFKFRKVVSDPTQRRKSEKQERERLVKLRSRSATVARHFRHFRFPEQSRRLFIGRIRLIISGRLWELDVLEAGLNFSQRYIRSPCKRMLSRILMRTEVILFVERS